MSVYLLLYSFFLFWHVLVYTCIVLKQFYTPPSISFPHQHTVRHVPTKLWSGQCHDVIRT